MPGYRTTKSTPKRQTINFTLIIHRARGVPLKAHPDYNARAFDDAMSRPWKEVETFIALPRRMLKRSWRAEVLHLLEEEGVIARTRVDAADIDLEWVGDLTKEGKAGLVADCGDLFLAAMIPASPADAKLLRKAAG